MVIEVLTTDLIDDEEIETQVEKLLEMETSVPAEAMALSLAPIHLLQNLGRRIVLQELCWIDLYPIDYGLERGNELYWNITTFQGSDNHWHVKGGEKVIFKTDSKEALDAFLYGFSLAYNVLPPEAFDVLKEEVRKLVE
jgi:hypothetical protein